VCSERTKKNQQSQKNNQEIPFHDLFQLRFSCLQEANGILRKRSKRGNVDFGEIV
jgi:hypothetical protein